MEILQIENLRTKYYSPAGTIPAVDGISFSIGEGETIGLVGESGCGKSATALSILSLIQPPGRVDAGAVRFFNGDKFIDLSRIPEPELRKVRGNEIAMIFQEPLSSFNPVIRVGEQIAEALKAHNKISSSEARVHAIEMLKAVSVPEPAQRFRAYPHELSGGLRQRAMIAMALICSPKVLIADEPTTALDVTVQGQILDLLQELKRKFKLSLLLISHDLSVVGMMADRVAVMYAGKIVELGDVGDVLSHPQHPYTTGLLRSLPELKGPRRKRLEALSGAVPNLTCLPAGCRFEPRCPVRVAECTAEVPALKEIAPGHWVSCVRAPFSPVFSKER